MTTRPTDSTLVASVSAGDSPCALASLLLAVAQPLTSGLFEEEGSFDVFFSLLIAAVLLLVFEEREHRRVAFSLGLAAFLGVWASHWLGGPAGRMLLVGAYLVAACFFAFALYGILRAILAKQASGDAILAPCAATFCWGSSGAFCTPPWRRLPQGPLLCRPRRHRVCDATGPRHPELLQLHYPGHGGIWRRDAATPLARTLAWMEAITGQFYLAILVAGLVGFKVTQAMRH